MKEKKQTQAQRIAALERVVSQLYVRQHIINDEILKLKNSEEEE
jgi:uncharacterized circularly permuted ATP-grasp superfamily protein